MNRYLHFGLPTGIVTVLILSFMLTQSSLSAEKPTVFGQDAAELFDLCITNDFGETFVLATTGEGIGVNVTLRGLRDGADTAWLVYNLITNEATLTTVQTGGEFALVDKLTYDPSTEQAPGDYISPLGVGSIVYQQIDCTAASTSQPIYHQTRTSNGQAVTQSAAQQPLICLEDGLGNLFKFDNMGSVVGEHSFALGTMDSTTCGDGWSALGLYNFADGTIAATAYAGPASSCGVTITDAGDLMLGAGGSGVSASDTSVTGPASFAVVPCP